MRKARKASNTIGHRHKSKIIFIEYRKRHLLWVEKRKREAAEAKRLAEEEAKTPRFFAGITDVLMGSAKRADMS